MQPDIQHAQNRITEELAALNNYLKRSFQETNKSLFDAFIAYLLQAPGKQLRAKLVLLIAGALGNITLQTRRGAALVTALHQASLVHDDVIDEAIDRRGRPSVNAVWGNKKAVLLGDYLLAKAIAMAIEAQDYTLLAMISKAAQAMSEGELLQLEQSSELAITEATYLEIIHKKTASLMAACCSMGALSANATVEQVETMYKIGEQLGMAFQIKDDLLDYLGYKDLAKLGKAAGMDIKGKKITLPLIYALQQADEHACQEIRHLISLYSHNPETFQQVVTFVHTLGGITYAQKKMDAYRDKALQLVDSWLQPSPYKKLLAELIYHTLEKN
jgi:octaprenyl-diphosphate synthase